MPANAVAPKLYVMLGCEELLPRNPTSSNRFTAGVPVVVLGVGAALGAEAVTGVRVTKVALVVVTAGVVGAFTAGTDAGAVVASAAGEDTGVR